MKIILSELGLVDRMISCKNGEEVVDFFKFYLNELKSNTSSPGGRDKAKQVALLLMDINMPLKSGLEAKKEVCDLYE